MKPFIKTLKTAEFSGRGGLAQFALPGLCFSCSFRFISLCSRADAEAGCGGEKVARVSELCVEIDNKIGDQQRR